MCQRNDRRTIVDRDHGDESVVLDLGLTLAIIGMRILEDISLNWSSNLCCFVVRTSATRVSRGNRVGFIATLPRRTPSSPSRNTRQLHPPII